MTQHYSLAHLYMLRSGIREAVELVPDPYFETVVGSTKEQVRKDVMVKLKPLLEQLKASPGTTLEVLDSYAQVGVACMQLTLMFMVEGEFSTRVGFTREECIEFVVAYTLGNTLPTLEV